MTVFCRMPGCDKEAKTLELCPACYSYLLNWNRKNPGEVLARMRKVQLWETRLEMFGMSPIKRPKINSSNRVRAMPGTVKYKLKPKQRRQAG